MTDPLIGATTAVFVIKLSVALTEPVDVAWSTKDGTAKAGIDYQAANGVVTFLPGDTEKQIQVTVYGQPSTGPNKKFYIQLTPPTNAILGNSLVDCTITVVDEDGTAITTVVVAQGKQGLKGDPGLSAYEQAVLMGYEGTVEQWMDSIADASQAATRAEEAIAEVEANAAKAEAAAAAAAFSGRIYPTPSAGVDPVTGVPNGAYFNVRSTDDDNFIDEYRNVGGVATSTGKSYPTSQYVKFVADHSPLPYVTGSTYVLHQRVQLDDGNIVRSTVNSNTNNPNSNMSGWVRVNDASQIFDASGKTQQQINDGLSSIAEMLAIRNPKNGSRVFVVGYHAGSLFGGGDFVYSKTSTLTADNGIVFDCPDGGKWIRLHKGKLDFYAYGAKFDGITDDTQAIKNALKNEYYKHIQHYDDGVAIITARTEKMPKGMTVRMGENAWVKINNPAGNIMCFLPADDCELKVNIDGGQLPLSGNVSDEWIGSNNFGIFTTVPEHSSASFANVNVKNVKVHGCKFKNIAFPVRADGSDNWDISGNYFYKIKQSGVLMGASALGGVYRNKVHHNTFIELGDTAVAANHINGLAAKSGQIECVSMTNNYVKNSQLRTGGSPFDFEGVTTVGESFGHLIANNIVEQLDTRPIPGLNIRGLAICGSNVQAVTIVNNVLKGSGADRGVAISITSTFDCVVKGNTVINNYGGGVSLVGSTGATVSDNDLIDSQGSSNNSPAILIASFANDLRTDNFTVTNNKIRNTPNYVRSGISDSISCNFGITSNALELNGVISGNTIHDPNGIAISVVGSVDRQISGIDITGNSVFSKYDTVIIYVSRAFDVNVSGLYARGGRGIRLSRCDGESVRLSDMYLKVTGLLFDISGCLNLNISDSKVVTSSASIFSDPSQFTDATKNNRMVNVTGSINSENKGRGVYKSASTAIAHGLTLPPKGINITPLTAGVTGLRVYGIGSQNFYVEYGGVVDAEFMWSASV